MLTPNYIFERLKNGKKPENALEEELVELLSGGEATPALEYAYDIYQNSYKREVIEAFILARATPEDVDNVLRVPPEVTKIYRTLFFNLTAFKDELDVEAYVQTYADDFGRELKVSATALGLDFLKFRFGRGGQELDPMAALKSMVESAYMFTKAAKLNPMNSAISKEARQWTQVVLKGLDAYVKIKPMENESSDEFEIALENIDRTVNNDKDYNIKLDDIVN